MVYIQKDKQIIEEFTVIDENNNFITGLTTLDFTIELYNSYNENVANISTGIEVEVIEVGNGIYRITFTPDDLGSWSLYLYHNIYFPYGKAENYNCVDYLGEINPETEELLKRVLGLSQENYRIFTPVYDTNNNMISATIKIYASALDCENNINPIASYAVTSTYDSNHRMSTYKVKKI